MCGIVGFSGGFNKITLQTAIKAIAHRGPDDSGIFFDENAGIGLGHSRLSILDLSSLGHQPMLSDDDSVAIVFNGEIYNFLDIKKELENDGYSFSGSSDTEVLLKLYLRDGESMLSQLNGVFSFVIWDSRSELLLIARDSFGVKPLYYYSSDDRFAFSSEIKALLHIVPEEKELDIEAVNRYLVFLWCPGKGTPLRSVKKISPGEAMIVRQGCILRKWNWYKLPAFRKTSGELDVSNSIEGTLSHLRKAVKRQMISDVPLGAFLSGGLDSSAVVAFAREKNPNIHCFTINNVGGQESGVVDDLPYAQRVAKHLDVELDVVSIDVNRMAYDFESMVVQLDEPLADPASLNVLYISKLARENGIKVLLSGAGGDDIFTGYRRHYALQLERFWNWMPKMILKGVDHYTSRLDLRKPVQRRIAKVFSGTSLEGNDRLINYFRWIDTSSLNKLFAPDIREYLATSTPSLPMSDYLEKLAPETPLLERMLVLDQRFFLADHNLNYTDKMSMAAGVEVRVPFLDHDLVDFASRIPIKYKQRGSIGKWVLKKAMEPYLPKDIIYRPKSGFGAPVRRWIMHDLRELVSDFLSIDSLKSRGLFSPLAVHQLIRDNRCGKIDASYTIFSLLCIEVWCRKYIDS